MTTTTKQHQTVVVRRHSNFLSQKTLAYSELFFLRCDSKSQSHLMKWLIENRKRSQREYSFRWHFQHERSFESFSQQKRSEEKSQNQKWSKEWLRKMRKDIETMSKRHLREFEKKKQNKKVTSIETSSSKIWWFIWLFKELFICSIVLYQSQQSSLFENLLRFIKILMICDDFKIKSRIKCLSKNNLADLNKKWKLWHSSLFIY